MVEKIIENTVYSRFLHSVNFKCVDTNFHNKWKKFFGGKITIRFNISLVIFPTAVNVFWNNIFPMYTIPTIRKSETHSKYKRVNNIDKKVLSYWPSIMMEI